MWKIYINALLKISVFVWTGLFTIVSIYKYNQNHFGFFHFFHIWFGKFRCLNLHEKAKFWRILKKAVFTMASFYYTRFLQGFAFLCKLGLLLFKPQWDNQFKYEREKWNEFHFFSSKNKWSRKQQRFRRDPYGSQLLCFRARFQTLFVHIVFLTDTLRSSKNCKVVPYMKKSRPR